MAIINKTTIININIIVGNAKANAKIRVIVNVNKITNNTKKFLPIIAITNANIIAKKVNASKLNINKELRNNC